MRRPLLCLAALAFAGSAALAEDRFCAGGDFSDSPNLRIGKIATNAPRVNFLRNGDEKIACPSVERDCRDKAFLVPGDLVVLGRRLDAFICVDYWTAQSGRSGWLPAIAVEPTPVLGDPADWIGDWKRVEAEIVITNSGAGLRAEGNATYGSLDPDRVKRGAVNLGDFSGPLDLFGGQATFADKDANPNQPDDFGCRIRMARAESFLFVQDNGQCGGMNVSFTGLYQRTGK